MVSEPVDARGDDGPADAVGCPTYALIRTLSLRDAFGRSRPFDASPLPGGLTAPTGRAGVLAETRTRLRATIRVSGLDGGLFVRSVAPPTEAAARIAPAVLGASREDCP